MIRNYNIWLKNEHNFFSDNKGVTFYDDHVNQSHDGNGEKEKWRLYWNKMSRDPHFEMDTIADYAKKHNISYEEAEKHFKGDNKNLKEFNMIGIPSGQIIYVNTREISHLKSSKLIYWKNIWKKMIDNGFIPIKIEQYCFDDKDYNKIINELKNIK